MNITIEPINLRYYQNLNTNKNLAPKINKEPEIPNTQNNETQNKNLSKISQVMFKASCERGRRVPDIDYEEYCNMSETTKARFRKKYNNFSKSLASKELIDTNYKVLPLVSENSMNEFIKISKIYNKFKDQPIISLGRSPKWFLNTSLWMKDGIEDYKFVAFSKYWYQPSGNNEMRQIESMKPTPKEEAAYKKYLKRKKVDPASIVKHMQDKNEKTIITDYICTGKGVTSFLDIMSRFAEEQGVLEEFSKSIQIIGIGSMEYMEELDPYAEEIATPKVKLPEKLLKYSRNIKQDFYNMNYQVFCDLLLNQNSNECRSTYYPHDCWCLYNPDKFKTGLVKDLNKIKKLAKENPRGVNSFSTVMRDYRNLLNFRILDGLNSRNLLKAVHKSKV